MIVRRRHPGPGAGDPDQGGPANGSPGSSSRIPPGTVEAYVGGDPPRPRRRPARPPRCSSTVCRHARRPRRQRRQPLARAARSRRTPLARSTIELVTDGRRRTRRATPTPPHVSTAKKWNGGSIDSAALNSTRRGCRARSRTASSTRTRPGSPSSTPALQPGRRRPAARGARHGRRRPRPRCSTRDPDVARHAVPRGRRPSARRAARQPATSRGFLHHAVRTGRHSDVAAVLQRMLVAAHDETPQCRRHGSSRVASYPRHPNSTPMVDALLARRTSRHAHCGRGCVRRQHHPRSHGATRGVAVVSAALHTTRRRPSTTPPSAPSTASASSGSTDYAPLIAAFADSPALADGAGGALHTLGIVPPAAAPGQCSTCARRSSPRTSTPSATSPPAPRAMPCMSSASPCACTPSTPDPSIRRRCLDLIDQLVVLRAHGIERDLDTIDR